MIIHIPLPFVGDIGPDTFADLTPVAVTDVALGEQTLDVTFESDLDLTTQALVILRGTGREHVGGVFSTGAIGEARISLVANTTYIPVGVNPETGYTVDPVVGFQNSLNFYTAFDNGSGSVERLGGTINAAGDYSGPGQGYLGITAPWVTDDPTTQSPIAGLYVFGPTSDPVNYPARISATAPVITFDATDDLSARRPMTVANLFWKSPAGDDWSGLANSWVELDAVTEPVGLMQDAAGTVHIRGRVSAGTIGSPVFTIPETVTSNSLQPLRYRPTQRQTLAVATDNAGTATLVVDTDGTVTVAAASTPADAQSWTSLDCAYTTL